MCNSIFHSESHTFSKNIILSTKESVRYVHKARSIIMNSNDKANRQKNMISHMHSVFFVSYVTQCFIDGKVFTNNTIEPINRKGIYLTMILCSEP